MLNKRNEPIPSNAVYLSVAFRRFIEHRFANLRDIESEAGEALHSAGGPYQLDAEAGEAGEWKCAKLPQLAKYDLARRQAELSFREWLSGDGPTACVLHPISGERLRIDHREWAAQLIGNFLPGFDEDFVSPNDIFSHGPSDAQFDGVLLKVFFDRDEFEIKLARLVGAVRRGKKPTHDWAAAETEARRLIEYHGRFSPDDPDWNCQARLEEAIAKHFERKLGPDFVPAESTIRLKIGEWLGTPKGR
jgi:hypothetical protein